jgi:hypothetical protein
MHHWPLLNHRITVTFGLSLIKGTDLFTDNTRPLGKIPLNHTTEQLVNIGKGQIFDVIEKTSMSGNPVTSLVSVTGPFVSPNLHTPLFAISLPIDKLVTTPPSLSPGIKVTFAINPPKAMNLITRKFAKTGVTTTLPIRVDTSLPNLMTLMVRISDSFELIGRKPPTVKM